jgi:hypothetical protein
MTVCCESEPAQRRHQPSSFDSRVPDDDGASAFRSSYTRGQRRRQIPCVGQLGKSYAYARPLRLFHASVASVSCACFMFYETTHETDADEELSISSPRRLCTQGKILLHVGSVFPAASRAHTRDIRCVPTSLPRHAARVVDHPSRRTADDQRAAEPVADAACSCGSQTVHRSAGTLCSGNTKWLCSVQTDCNHRHDLCCG